MAVSSTTGGLRTGVCLSTDRPQNPYNGQVIYETDTNRTLVWDNSAWVVIADASTTGFPTSLDTGTVGAIEALQAKVGVDGSAVTSSLDYKVGAVEDGLSAARPLLTDGAFIDGTNGLVLSGLSGNYASSPDSAALSITGDIDIKAKVTMTDWTPSAAQTVVSKYLTTGNQRAYRLDVNTSGTLQIYTSADGSAFLSSASSVATGVADGATKWVRATLDVDDGAGNRIAKFYLSDDGTTWSQLGTTVTTAGNTSIFDGTAELRFGDTGGLLNLVGTVHRAIIQDAYDTANNTSNVVFDADFAAEAADTLAFTEDSTNAATVSVNTTRYTVGLPGSSYQSVGTSSVSANRDHFHSFPVTQPIEVDMFVFESTTGPASNATIHAAVYAATDDYQPTGAPLITWTGTVGTSATGVFYLQTSPVTLPSGQYVLALNSSLTFTWRSIRRSAPLLHTMGASPFTFGPYAARTNAAFPNPSAGWNLQSGSSSSEAIYAVLRWRPL